MILEERFELAATPQAIWDFLLDPRTLAKAIPGCEELVAEDERTYRATVRVKVGFLKFRFRMKTVLTRLEAPWALESVTEGEDLGLAGGFRATNGMLLRELAPGRSELTYRSQVGLTGRLATFGNRILQGKAEQQAREFIAAVRQGVERPVAG